MGLEYMPQGKDGNLEVTLDSLKITEERCEQALEEAMTDGKTSEAVIEELQSMYWQAKHAREDFEANS